VTAADLRRNAHVLVLQELRSRFTEAGSPSRTSALDAAIAALATHQPVAQEPVTVEAVATVQRDSDGDRYIDWLTEGGIADLEACDVLMVSDRRITDESGSGEVYAVPPAQAVDPQAALLAEERAHGETIDQRDHYHEVADKLAGHIAAITGVDIGEHSSANCPWQNAIEAAEAYQPAQAVEMSPDFTDTARAAIAWVLWHHQGGGSPVGQPLRYSLGMGQHDRMTDPQIAEAKRFAAWAGATTEGFHQDNGAHGVDLTAVRAALDAAEGLAIACASVDCYSREEVAASGRAMKQQFADARALIDGQAVRNG